MGNTLRSTSPPHAIWFTWPRDRPPMLNRERTSQQLVTPTRSLPGAEPVPKLDTPVDGQLRAL